MVRSSVSAEPVVDFPPSGGERLGEIEGVAKGRIRRITRDQIRDAERDPHVFSQRPPTTGPELGTERPGLGSGPLQGQGPWRGQG